MSAVERHKYDKLEYITTTHAQGPTFMGGRVVSVVQGGPFSQKINNLPHHLPHIYQVLVNKGKASAQYTHRGPNITRLVYENQDFWQ